MNNIAEILLASGISGLVVALVLFVFLMPAVKNSIEHSYKKLLEQAKTDQVIVQKRFDIASNSINEMAVLHEALLLSLKGLSHKDDVSPSNLILNEVHPYYRAQFRVLRSRLETTNDLLSFYSLSFDSLLHPESIKSILLECDSIKSLSDHKYAYRSIWLAVIESMHSLLRVTSSHKFWNSDESYPNRARVWAEHERDLLVIHFVDRLNGNLDDNSFFSLQIEKEGGVRRFWQEVPNG